MFSLDALRRPTGVGVCVADVWCCCVYSVVSVRSLTHSLDRSGVKSLQLAATAATAAAAAGLLLMLCLCIIYNHGCNTAAECV